MTELSRILLTAAREGLAPDAATMARVRAKVAASVAVGAVAATPTKAAAATKSALIVKLGAIVLAVGVTSAVIVGSRGERTADVPNWSVASTGEDDVRVAEQVAAVDVVVVPAMTASTTARPEAAKPAPPTKAKAVPGASGASTTVTSTAADSTNVAPATLSREVELIDLAMVSLRKAAPRAALEAIRVFERETFGRGQMAEEAAAIEIEAHCHLHDDVTEKLAAFDRKWPSSAQRERIQTTCFGR